MKKLITVATVALAMAFSAVSFAQQDQSTQPSAQQPSSGMQNGQQTGTDQQSAQPSSPSQSPDSSSSMQNSQGTAFTGTVVKAAGKYVLKTSDMNYQLNDQDKAKQFVGQQVKVNGTLDSSTSMIHISDISPLS
jgi:Protein of unknown function (DUF5818)